MKNIPNNSTASLSNSLADLVSLTHLYLIQEHGLDKHLIAGRDTFCHFRDEALKQKRKDATPPAPPRELPPIEEAPKQAAPIARVETYKAQKSPPIAPQEAIHTPNKEKDNSEHIQEPLSQVPPKTQPPTERVVTSTTTTKTETTNEAKVSFSFQKIALEPITAPPKTDFTTIRACVQKLFPQYPVTDHIPANMQTQYTTRIMLQGSMAGMTIALLALHPTDEEMTMLTRLCDAIHQQVQPAALLSAAEIEAGNYWGQLIAKPSLKLIIAPSSCLQVLQNMRLHHRTVGTLDYLHNIALLQIEAPASYLHDNKKKAALWQAIRTFPLPEKK